MAPWVGWRQGRKTNSQSRGDDEDSHGAKGFVAAIDISERRGIRIAQNGFVLTGFVLTPFFMPPMEPLFRKKTMVMIDEDSVAIAASNPVKISYWNDVIVTAALNSRARSSRFESLRITLAIEPEGLTPSEPSFQSFFSIVASLL